MSADLSSLFEDWKSWRSTADQSEEGWESDFPRWQALLDAARHTMMQTELTTEMVATLAECWSADQEDEELLQFAADHPRDCWAALQSLAKSNLPGCRWQVYEAVASMGAPAEPMLRLGLADPDAYARRRALLSLARLRPADARLIAEMFLKDPDPYMRQAAIEMVRVAADASFQRDALDVLRQDPVPHVRKAADAAWQKMIKPADKAVVIPKKAGNEDASHTFPIGPRASGLHIAREVHLAFSLAAEAHAEHPPTMPCDGESLMNRLLDAGVEVLVVDWEHLGLVRLAVEDDAIFIADAVNELSSLEVTGGTHYVYLGDGDIEVSATNTGRIVEVRTRFSRGPTSVSQDKFRAIKLDAYCASWIAFYMAIAASIQASSR